MIISFSFSSCAVKWKKDSKQKTDQSTETTSSEAEMMNEIDDPKASDNWADSYYEDTYFVVKNPILVENYTKLSRICKGEEFNLVVSYQSKVPAPVKYKGDQVTIKTKSGFIKKVYITKGACRELSLYLGGIRDQAKQIRKEIKEMKLKYIYNEGTFLVETIFSTPFSEVEFFVK